MDLLKTSLVEELETVLKRRISYDSISPSILRDMEIRSLRIRNTDGSPFIDIPRLRIHYDLVELIFGNPALAVDEITLENAFINLDLEKDRDLADLLRSRGGTGRPGASGASQPRIRITGRNLKFNLRAGEDELKAERVFFQLRPLSGGYDLRLKSLLSYTNSRRDAVLRKGGTLVEVQGLLSPGYDLGEATVGLSMFSTNLFDLKKQTFQVSFDRKGIKARKIQDRAPLDFSVFYDAEAKTLRGEYLSYKFRPAALITMKDKLSFLNEWFGSQVSLRGSLNVNTVAKSLRYAAEFDGIVQNSVIQEETRFEGKAEGNLDSLLFSPVKASNRYGNAEFQGDILFRNNMPEGRLSVSDAALFGTGLLDAAFDLKREGDGLRISGSPVSWGAAVFYDFRAGLKMVSRSLELNGRFSFDEDGRSEAKIDFRFPLQAEALSRFNVDLREIPSSGVIAVSRNLLRQAPGRLEAAVGVPLRLTGALSGSTDFRTLNLDVPLFTMRDENDEDNRIELSGTYDAGVVDLRRWDFRWNEYYGGGKVLGEFIGGRRFRFSSEMTFLDIPYSFNGVLDPRGSLEVEGQYGLTAELFWKDSGPLEGFLALRDFPLPLLHETMEISGKIDAHYKNTDFWYLDTKSLQIKKFSALPHVKGEIVLSATAGPKLGSVHRLTYKDQFSNLAGGGKFNYSFDPLAASGDFSLAGTDAKERYELTLRYQDRSLSGKLTFQGLPAERLIAEKASGRLGGTVDFGGLPKMPEISLSARLSDGFYKNDPISFDFSGAMNGGRITVDTFDLLYSGVRLKETTARFDSKTGALRFLSVLDRPGGAAKNEWNIEADFNVTLAEASSPAERLLKADLAGEFVISTLSESVKPFFRYWGFEVRKEKRTAHIKGGPENSLEAVLDESGAFTVSARSPLPLSFEAEGVWKNDQLEANINNISFLAEEFGRLLDFGFIKFRRGTATGNLRIAGPVRDPDFFGTVSVVKGSTVLDLIPEEIGPYRGNLIFREKEIALQPMIVPVGRGSAEVSGVFQIDHWIPRAFSLNIDTKLSQGVRIANNFSGVIVDGIGRGRVRIDGDSQRVSVSGEVHASNAVITLGDLKAASENRRGNATPIIVDLVFETGKAVEFYWPSESFPILQTNAALGEKLSLQYNGETLDFRLVGDISVRGGEILYFNRTFFIREGTIRFNEKTGSFEPLLNVRAEIRENTEEGLVRIYLVADNTKLSQQVGDDKDKLGEFSPRFESDSGLTDDRIRAILGQNVMGVRPEDSINPEAAILLSLTRDYLASSDYLMQARVIKAFEKNMRERLSVDLFSVRTYLVQNLLQGVVGTETDIRTENETPSFGRYLDKTSLFLGKYIGSDLFLELLLQFRADDPLVQRTRDFGGLNIDTELILEWKTPLFLLEWSFFPKNPDELFIFDNKFTFRWKFSY